MSARDIPYTKVRVTVELDTRFDIIKRAESERFATVVTELRLFPGRPVREQRIFSVATSEHRYLNALRLVSWEIVS